MRFYTAPYYTDSQLEQLDESQVHFPYSDKNATYIGKKHQYELTEAYFTERGRNLQNELESDDPEKVAHFLAYLRMKVYQYIYNHNQSTKKQLDYMIAKRGITGYSPYEYREAFLEAMFLEGEYLIDNGDISQMTGVNFEIMQNFSSDVMRSQDRDFNPNAIKCLLTLGLNFYGKYRFIPQGEDW